MSIESPTFNHSLTGEVLGITDRSDTELAVAQASKMLGHQLLESYAIAEALEPQVLAAGDRDEYERIIDSLVVHGLLDTSRTELQDTSTLTDWLSYQAMMEEHGTKADGDASALMIGSLSPVSSRAFACLARAIYGATDVRIVDLQTSAAKRNHGTFEVANGLALPLPDESVDFVHTNNLLHWLKRSAQLPMQIALTKALLKEATRVLAPGGQLLMHERALGSEPKDEFNSSYGGAREIGALVTRVLQRKPLLSKRKPMVKVHVVPAKLPTTLDYLFDEDRDFQNQPSQTSYRTIDVFAQKAA